jgi:hypothetical protein
MGGFALDTVVTPVSLVDSDITLAANLATPLVNVPASAGEITAPAAGTRLATTGALPAGPYSMTFWVSAGEATALRVRRRNAADTLDVWSFRPHLVANNFYNFALRLVLALNEFVVVENVGVGSAGIVYQASIFSASG